MPCGVDGHFYIYVLPLVLVESGFFAYALESDLRTFQVILGLVGLWWCLAALWVEVKLEQTYPHFQYDNPVDPEMKEYRPFCDFAPWATCSKVLMSPPGRFLRYFGIAKYISEGANDVSLLDKLRGLIDVPNPTLGVLFFGCHLVYPVLLVIPILNEYVAWLFFAACCFVGLMTVWLAYNLFFVLKDFCIVCVSMYVANFALIPMMYNIAKSNWVDMSDFQPFFGTVPQSVLYPFIALDALMLVAVLALYLCGGKGAKAREGADGLAFHQLLDADA